MAIDISVEKKCNVLIGKDGSGKTTLLDYISGLKREEGTVIIRNENLVYVNQGTFFSDRLCVREFVKFFYRLDNVKNHRQMLISFNETYGNRFDLDKLWEKQIGVLSGGEERLLYFLLIISLDKS